MLLCARQARADLSNRVFVGDFVGDDADIENYFSASGGVGSKYSAASFYLEKTISERSSFSIFGGLERVEADGEAETGWNNVEIAYKREVIVNQEHEFRLSLEPGVELPTGSGDVGAEKHSRAGINLLMEKGWGDLPDWMALVRPLAFEGGALGQAKVTGARDDLVAADAEIEYSIGYLDSEIGANRITHALSGFTPHVDFDYSQFLSAHRNSSQPDFELTPGLAWYNAWLEINLGAQIAVNQAAAGSGRVGFVWLIGISYDQLWQAAAWTPF